MGTTLVAATIIDGRLYVANVGDSRLYIIGTDGIRQITRIILLWQRWSGSVK